MSLPEVPKDLIKATDEIKDNGKGFAKLFSKFAIHIIFFLAATIAIMYNTGNKNSKAQLVDCEDEKRAKDHKIDSLLISIFNHQGEDMAREREKARIMDSIFNSLKRN